MRYDNIPVLIAFESMQPGELVEIAIKDTQHSCTGRAIEKSPHGYYDKGWCVKIKPVDSTGTIEISRESIATIMFLRERNDLQPFLPFEDDQYSLGI